MPSEVCLSIQDMLTGQRLCQSSSHNDTVLAALNQQRNDGILCDITLIAEEQKFPAHKAVLAACSDYFRVLLEPGVIQDVLAAGSHLQLLEMLSLCSHYLIQVRIMKWIFFFVFLISILMLYRDD
uniref:BTB domain-containing protein n=1 Tax=Laticauda laticaudata TaxID=8630 RepID=A0A8C5WZ52_LATLA